MQQYTILLAHGSSDPNWTQSFESIAKPLLAQNPHSALAYLELSEPSLESAVRNGAALGYRDFQILPLFLASGRHMREDAPGRLKALSEELDLDYSLLPPIGEHPALAEAIVKIVEESNRLD